MAEPALWQWCVLPGSVATREHTADRRGDITVPGDRQHEAAALTRDPGRELGVALASDIKQHVDTWQTRGDGAPAGAGVVDAIRESSSTRCSWIDPQVELVEADLIPPRIAPQAVNDVRRRVHHEGREVQ